MSSIYDKSSLVLIPSGTKTSKVYSQKPTNGDGDFDFTRSTAATRIAANGNIEKETQNLLLQSNTFNTTWTQNGVSVTGNQTGYNGNDAWLLESTGASGSLRQSISYSSVICYSFYAKAGSANYVRLRLDAATQVNAWFNLSNGSVGTLSDGISSSMESVGNGWWRVSVTANATSLTTIRVYPSPTDAGGNSSGDNIYIQDAQVNQGLIAQEVITTTTTALYGGITDNVPRLDYTDSSCPALLLEPQRTNSVFYSEYFGAWDVIGGSVTITNNNAASPEGVQNAALATGSGAQKYVLFRDNIAVSSAGDYVMSAFFKYTNNQWIYMSATNFDGGGGAYFDIQNGVVGQEGTPNTASVEDYGNGWYRCSVKMSIGASDISGRFTLYVARTNGTTDHSTTAAANGKSVNVWGASIENGSYLTSYIPCMSTSVTRNADACSKTGISSLIGQTEGTIFGEFTFTANFPTMHMFASVAGSFASAVYVQTFSATGISMQVWSGVVNQVGINSSGLTIGQNVKFAAAYKNNDFVFYVNGTQVGTDTSGSVPSGLSQLEVGGYAEAGSPFNFNTPMKQALLFKTRLSNQELQDLTTL